MNKLLFGAVLLLALQSESCGTADAAKPSPALPESGRTAMAVDGKRPGKLEKQTNGTYLLRYPDGKADAVSVNEVVLMPESK